MRYWADYGLQEECRLPGNDFAIKSVNNGLDTYGYSNHHSRLSAYVFFRFRFSLFKKMKSVSWIYSAFTTHSINISQTDYPSNVLK